MLLTENIKKQKTANVEKDRQEIAKSMAEYESEKQKKKAAEQEKRVRIMEMMQ